MESKLKQKLFIGRILGMLYYEDFSPFLDQIMLNQTLFSQLTSLKEKKKGFKKADILDYKFKNFHGAQFLKMPISQKRFS